MREKNTKWARLLLILSCFSGSNAWALSSQTLCNLTIINGLKSNLHASNDGVNPGLYEDVLAKFNVRLEELCKTEKDPHAYLDKLFSSCNDICHDKLPKFNSPCARACRDTKDLYAMYLSGAESQFISDQTDVKNCQGKIQSLQQALGQMDPSLISSQNMAKRIQDIIASDPTSGGKSQASPAH